MLELLAPAGDLESLTAALESGADSVYLGARSFSARASAKNFDGEGLRRALDEAHGRGASVYVTMNTLLFGAELGSALELAGELYAMGADALIVQDAGFAALLRKNLPDLPLHASTQACIHDAGGLEYAIERGFSRVVLSREVPISDIAKLAQMKIELEVFGHGALCSAFSGGCLFSSMVGGRSGNRGACAQPCRLPYRLSRGENTASDRAANYKASTRDFADDRTKASDRANPRDSSDAPAALLSLKDLCTIEHIPALEKSGVKALKIEGRMRGAAYVAAVTRAYRAVLDGAPAGEQRALLEHAMHHGGYCTGYLFSNEGLSEPQRPASWRMPEAAKPASYSREIPLSASVALACGEESRLSMSALGQEVEVTGAAPQAAQNAPLTKEKLEAAFVKLGDTPFKLAAFDAELGENLFLPSAKLNELRRDGVNALVEAIRGSRRRELPANVNDVNCDAPSVCDVHDIHTNVSNKRIGANDENKRNDGSQSCLDVRYEHYERNEQNERHERYERVLTAQVVSVAQAKAAGGADWIVFKPLDWRSAADEILDVRRCLGKEQKLFLRLPSVLMMEDWKVAEPAINIAREIADGAVASNAGQVKFLTKNFKLVLGGHELNITNAASAEVYQSLGIRPCASVELTMRGIRDILELCPDVVAYGRVPLMTLLHCPMKDSGKNCHDCGGNKDKCRGSASLIDRKGESFKLEQERLGTCHVNVLNAHRLDLLRSWPKEKISPRLLFSEETPSQVEDIVASYIKAMNEEAHGKFGETTGRYYAKPV